MFPLPGARRRRRRCGSRPASSSASGAGAKGKNAEEAKAFIDFLGKQENINAWAKADRRDPAHPGRELHRSTRSLESFLPYHQGQRAVPFMDQRWPNAEVQPTHFAVVQELLGGQDHDRRALKKMDEAYRK